MSSNQIKGIGIAYQMHGMVVVDNQQEVLRPSIVWCDSRVVEIKFILASILLVFASILIVLIIIFL